MGTFDVQVDASRAALRLEEMSPEVRDALIVAVTLAAGELEGSARSKASGDLLQVRTGKFVKSIKAGVRTSGNRITGRVYSKDPRAGLFEACLPVSVGLPDVAASTRSPGSSFDKIVTLLGEPGSDQELVSILVDHIYPALDTAYGSQLERCSPFADPVSWWVL